MYQYVYLDHNILDALIKKRINNINDILTLDRPIFVYSNETLIEIIKSKGFEDDFLNQLFLCDAKYMFIEHDNLGKNTGYWNITDADPHHLFQDLINARSEFTDQTNFGLDTILQKLYGGEKERTYSEILTNGSEDIIQIFEEAILDLKEEVDNELYNYLLTIKTEMIKEMRIAQEESGRLLDKEKIDISIFEQEFNLGPKQLKNIKGNNIVQQVWEIFKEHLPDDISFEDFFGIQKEKNLFETCSAVYHSLNFLGYYRDKKMKKLNRTQASFCDMTHVACASRLDILLSNDEDLCIKARAVYEYTGVSTKVIFANI